MSERGNLVIFGAKLFPHYADAAAETLEALNVFSDSTTEYSVFPGFCDVHVHFREPGFSYKETIETGSRAAAHGGYTCVCAMPNLDPVPDSLETLGVELEAVARGAVIDVIPYGAITKGEKGEALSDMADLAPKVCAFSDDGRGVQSDDMMRAAMARAKSLNKMIVAHCEVNEMLRGGYIHDGAYAAAHGHRGICSESEWRQIERDLKLADETGCAYHVCHISCRESVELIRQAKASGVNVSCETAPHYLLLDEGDLQENGRFKMNPPLRGRRDREALLEGVCDGTIDMIATDHAPHSAEEKSRGLEKSAFGIVGIETAFPLLYTYLVQKGVFTMDMLLELIAYNPRRRFGLTGDCGFTVWNLNRTARVEPSAFLSKGKATPFEGWPVNGECVLTACGGKIAYRA